MLQTMFVLDAFGNCDKVGPSFRITQKVVNEGFENLLFVIHRRLLWKSLFIYDSISYINLGRPLAANDYNWDDQRMNFIAASNENFRQCKMPR